MKDKLWLFRTLIIAFYACHAGLRRTLVVERPRAGIAAPGVAVDLRIALVPDAVH